MQATLLQWGYRLEWLGTDRLTWLDLKCLLKWAPQQSPIYRALHGDAAGWDTTAYLLAAAVDALNDANWQRGGGRRGERPQRIPRPGDNEQIGGKRPVPVDEMRRLLALRRRGITG